MIVIYHNPNCGTSRNVVQITRDAGYDPVVIEYLDAGWTKPQLLGLLAAADLTVEQLLRTTKLPVDAMSRLERCVSEHDYLEAMVDFPILVNRPIVCSPKGVKLCRPSEQVLTLLDKWPKGPYFKEDGQQILDASGKATLTFTT